MASKSSIRTHTSQPPPSQNRHVSFNLPVYSYTKGTQWGFNQLIPAHPGIAQMDNVTLTLANHLAYLDGDAGILRSLLMRAGRSQRRWSLEGKPQDVSPMDTGIASDLVEVLSSAERLQTAVNQLCVQGAVVLCMYPGGEGRDVLRMDAGTRAKYKLNSVTNSHHTMLQALLLVCHAFPADAYLDDDYHELGSAFTPQLQHVMQYYDNLQALGMLSNEVKQTIAYTLLHSFQFSSTAGKWDVIERAEKIAASLAMPDKCLDMMILSRKTYLDRSTVAPEEFDRCSGFSMESGKLNALCGKVFLTRSNMYLRNSADIDMAFSFLQEIRPIDWDNISILEELILQERAIAWGRLLRFQGQFQEARSLLEAVYNARQYPEDVISAGELNCDLISHLAATHCELGDPEKADFLVSTKLESILEKYNTSNPNSKPRKGDMLKLRLAQAEAALQQGEHWRAADMYRELNRYIWATRGHRNSIRSVCRMHMGLARVQQLQSDWPTSLKYWERAMRMYDKRPDSQDFGTVVTYAAIAYVHIQMGNEDDAIPFFIKGGELLKVTGHQHWYTGLGTGWFDEIWDHVTAVLSPCWRA
ncbi:conserved hypothetical protein [Talaromyces stipitatus ATCC 10500]|uniref:Uncharacterized protein n=1 Tax=Talaromyces stipitatus (strain ATCC 10500 / CBS 375.48 / QM 6759 / NRRL 1006) TaxID=441959 RepID=B8LVF8_TALSN|nr:uncharacterized protein TSTA_073650 [Talaromyces stipitatus ATCC 10500]EED23977.1 conserved hypothetical protein [Talaromyces stipitatus ATCC 10500]